MRPPTRATRKRIRDFIDEPYYKCCLSKIGSTIRNLAFARYSHLFRSLSFSSKRRKSKQNLLLSDLGNKTHLQKPQAQMKQIQEDKIISEFFTIAGTWREFVIVGGGFALFIYKCYLADPKLENFPVGTRDIDSLIPRKVRRSLKKISPKYLNQAGFIHIFKMSRFLQPKVL